MFCTVPREGCMRFLPRLEGMGTCWEWIPLEAEQRCPLPHITVATRQNSESSQGGEQVPAGKKAVCEGRSRSTCFPLCIYPACLARPLLSFQSISRLIDYSSNMTFSRKPFLIPSQGASGSLTTLFHSVFTVSIPHFFGPVRLFPPPSLSPHKNWTSHEYVRIFSVFYTPLESQELISQEVCAKRMDESTIV